MDLEGKKPRIRDKKFMQKVVNSPIFTRKVASVDPPVMENIKRIRVIPVSDIVVEEQVRKKYDLEGLKNLAESIKRKGLLQPVLVTETADGKYRLEAGHRRFFAVRDILKEDSIEVLVLKQNISKDERHIIQLYENLVREDLHPAEIALALGPIAARVFADTCLQDGDGELCKKIQGFTAKEVVASFVSEAGYLLSPERFEGVVKNMWKNLLEELAGFGLGESAIAVLIYLYAVMGEDVEELVGYNFTLSHLVRLYKYGVKDPETMKEILKVVHEKKLTVRELESRLKQQKKDLPKGRERFLKKTTSFIHSIRRSRIIKKDPELRQRLVEMLRMLIEELEAGEK